MDRMTYDAIVALRDAVSSLVSHVQDLPDVDFTAVRAIDSKVWAIALPDESELDDTRPVCGERFGRTGVCDLPKGHPPIALPDWLHSQTIYR